MGYSLAQSPQKLTDILISLYAIGRLIQNLATYHTEDLPVVLAVSGNPKQVDLLMALA